MGVEDAYRSLAERTGLEFLDRLALEPLTPLLLEGAGAGLAPAARGRLPGGVEGVAGAYSYTRNTTFRFNLVLTEVAESRTFAPRLFCVRQGRRTRDDVFYGFQARHTRLWTESVALSERYSVATSPIQDENWMRQLFSPTFIDWLTAAPPADFSFELAYGALVCSVEQDDPGVAGLTALSEAAAQVAERIRRECKE
jgi:hypothetical protein